VCPYAAAPLLHRAAKAFGRLLHGLLALAPALRNTLLDLVFEIVEDRVLGVLALVLNTVQATARMGSAEALSGLWVPIQHRHFLHVASVARAEVSGDINRIEKRNLLAACAPECLVTIVLEMPEVKLGNGALEWFSLVVPARVGLANARLLLLAVIQDWKTWVWACSSTAEFRHVH